MHYGMLKDFSKNIKVLTESADKYYMENKMKLLIVTDRISTDTIRKLEDMGFRVTIKISVAKRYIKL